MDRFSTLQRVLSRGRSWWIPPVVGLSFCLFLPPFNHEMHPLLAPFPLLSLVALVPLLFYATLPSVRRAALYSWLFGMTASASQFYWIVFDTAEGVWHLIILGVVMICIIFGAYYLAMAMAYRAIRRFLPRYAIAVFPAVWVLGEYLRTLGEISFPWTLIGYSWTPVLPLAQLSAIGGVYLVSYAIVAGNVVAYELTRHSLTQGWRYARKRSATVYIGLLIALSVWGGMRLRNPPQHDSTARFCCLQPNLDHLHGGEHSLDTSFSVAQRLVLSAVRHEPDCMVLPESSLLTFVARRPTRRARVSRWADSVETPLILGALHWDKGPEGSAYEYLVYNTAFLALPGTDSFLSYYKMKLVPFSEALPFEGVFPLLSRVNLGEADFMRGTEPVVFEVNDTIAAVPLICYEVIYPAFVRGRLHDSANVLVNITNDGWFGNSPGPFHHAQMARLRCIENGVSLVRSANTGISMLVDQFGRVLGRTELSERTILCGEVPLGRVKTAYARWGDWVVWLSAAVVGLTMAWGLWHTAHRTTPSTPDRQRSRHEEPSRVT